MKNRKKLRKKVAIYLSSVILVGQAQTMEDDNRDWIPRTAKDFSSRKGQEYLRKLEKPRDPKEKPTPEEQAYWKALEDWKNGK